MQYVLLDENRGDLFLFIAKALGLKLIVITSLVIYWFSGNVNV